MLNTGSASPGSQDREDHPLLEDQREDLAILGDTVPAVLSADVEDALEHLLHPKKVKIERGGTVDPSSGQKCFSHRDYGASARCRASAALSASAWRVRLAGLGSNL